MDSNRVHMIIGGQLASVPAEHVEKFKKKQMLVARANELHNYINSLSEVGKSAEATCAGLELKDLMGKIIRLNRRLPECVRFV